VIRVLTIGVPCSARANIVDGLSEDACMADEVVTVLDRLTSAGLSREAIDRHLAVEGITVDGEVVTDLQKPAPPPARVVLQR
jgi:hypothetical protein